MATGYRILEGATRQFIRERTRGADQRGDGLAQFAALIGTTPAHLSNVLRGNVPLTYEMGRRIANGLGVPLDAVTEPVRDNDDEPEEVVAS